MKQNEKRYEERFNAHLEVWDVTNESLRKLGDAQERARRDVTMRMVDFLRKNAKQVRLGEQQLLEGVEGTQNPVVGMAKLDPDYAGWLQGLVRSGAAGGGAAAGIGAAVYNFGTAGTGTKISELHGIAKKNAAEAFLGGGPRSKGGGGMLWGGRVRNAAVAGSTLLVAGLAVKDRGTKARTEAEDFLSQVEVAMAHLDKNDQYLAAAQARAHELGSVLDRLVARAAKALDTLEAEPFVMALHGERLQTALMLTKSVGEVTAAPIVDGGGALDGGTARLIFRYRNA